MPPESFVRLGERRFAYLDFGGPGPVLLALHGHFGRARTFAPPAEALAGRYRVVGLDQRAHGLSDRGGDLTAQAYVTDAADLLRTLGLARPPSWGTRWEVPPPTSSPGATPNSLPHLSSPIRPYSTRSPRHTRFWTSRPGGWRVRGRAPS